MIEREFQFGHFEQEGLTCVSFLGIYRVTVELVRLF